MPWCHFVLQKEDVPAQLLESVSEDEGSGIALEIGNGTVAGVAHGLLTGDAQGEFLFVGVFVFVFRGTLFSRLIFPPHLLF